MKLEKIKFTFIFTSIFMLSYDWLCPFFMNEYGSLFMIGYMLTDLYLHHIEMNVEYIIHHLFAIHLCMCDYILDGSDKNVYKKLFFQTEYSTIFLNLYLLSKNKYILFLFICLFIYFRLYCISTFYFFKKTSPFYYQDISGIGLYGLNIYWFCMIINKMKQLILSKNFVI
jgi:hypothetical protein